TASAFDPDSADTPEQTEFYDYDYEPTQPEESLQAAASIELPAHDELSNTTAQPDTDTPSSEPNVSPSPIVVDESKSDNQHIDSAKTEDPEATSATLPKYSTALTVFHEPREVIESHFPPAIPSMPTDNQSEPLASAQSTDNDLVCNKCGFVAVSKRGLANHFWQKHPDPATASKTCPYCSKIFNNKWKLSKHILQHNDKGNKKFKCDTCGVSFKRKYKLANHLRVHAKNAPTLLSEKIGYPCDTCTAEFSCNEELLQHMSFCGRRSLSNPPESTPLPTIAIDPILANQLIDLLDNYDNLDDSSLLLPDTLDDIFEEDPDTQPCTGTSYQSTLNTNKWTRWVVAQKVARKRGVQPDDLAADYDQAEELSDQYESCASEGEDDESSNSKSDSEDEERSSDDSTHAEHLFACQQCSFISKSQFGLSVHIGSKHPQKPKILYIGSEKRYLCPKCDHHSARLSELMVHLENHHSQTSAII
ncbi:C2H2-type zinc finger protein, partial [Candidatus Dependentiae bacterium]|nr:C2H2-type zinc finger protein [Candidatus Dependentiae bacterium]